MAERPQRENDAIEVGRVGPVTTILLNRSEKRNALTPALVATLATALRAEMDSASTRVIVLTNSGTTFCSGADLSGLRPGHSEAEGPEDAPRASFADLLRIITEGSKPVIGRINGHAMGAGLDSWRPATSR